MADQHWPDDDNNSSQPQSHFLCIPAELRNRIYEDLLAVPTVDACIAIVHDDQTFGTPRVLRLLLTCRQIHDEAMGIFSDLNTLYFNIGALDLPNFHRFIRALSPQRRRCVKRINIDLATVESVAPVLRLLTRLSGLESLTLGFPRGHDCFQEGLSMRKLGRDEPVIRDAIFAMEALNEVKVVVVGSEYRRQDLLAICDAGVMQRVLQTFVGKVYGVVDFREAEMRRIGEAIAVCKDRPDGSSAAVGARRAQSQSEAAAWPKLRFASHYERIELSPSPPPWPWH